MNNTLKVQEKYSRHWPMIAILSAVLATVFYISYQLTADVLLGGYLRLTAFAFFALAVLSLFKVKDGRVEISLTGKDNILEIVYRVRDKVVHNEELLLTDVESIKVDKMPDKSLYNQFIKSDRSIRFKRKKAEGWLYLHEIHGRVIPLTYDNARTIVQFVQKQMGNE
jgi:hypothetical protein